MTIMTLRRKLGEPAVLETVMGAGYRRLMPRPTVRLRMTLLYAGVFLLAGAALLTVSYVLVRNNLTADHVSVGSGPADELRRAIQREVADDALHHLRIQYAIALAAMTAALGPAGLARRRVAPCARCSRSPRRRGASRRTRSTSASPWRARATSSRSWPTPSTRMLERLSGAFASQRRFVANASHELRTPLTVMRTELEVTLADPDATNAELRDHGRGGARCDGPHRAPRPVAADARALRGRGHPPRPARPRERRAPGARARRARRATPPAWRSPRTCTPRPCRGDRRLLESLVANLVENAVGHNRPGGRVSVTTSSRDGRSVVEVVNDGDVARPPTCCRRLLEPFQRIDRGARGDGAGLGLSIVALGRPGPRRRRRARRVPRRRPARHRDPSARRTGGADPTRPLLSGACPCLSADPSCAVRPTWPP